MNFQQWKGQKFGTWLSWGKQFWRVKSSNLWAKFCFLRDQVYIRVKALFTPGWAYSYWRVQVWVFSLVWGTYYRFGGCLENKQAVIPLPGCESWYHPVTCAYISLISAKFHAGIAIFDRSNGHKMHETTGGSNHVLFISKDKRT